MEEKRGDGNTGEGEIFDCERTNKDCKLQPNREDRVNKRPSTVRVIGMDKAVVKKRASRRAKKKGIGLGDAVLSIIIIISSFSSSVASLPECLG